MTGSGGTPADRYLDALAGSWRGLAAARPTAEVVEAPGLLVLRHPDPVLTNAVALTPAALAEALALLADEPAAVWTAAGDAAMTAAVRASGLRPDVTTTPMVRSAELPPPDAPHHVVAEVEPLLVCRLNGVADDLLTGVPDLRCFGTCDGAAALAAQDVGEGVVLSFVTTVPEARGRGLASAVTAAALRDAAQRGRPAAALQATPAAERLYARLGFVPVGRWQEWVRP